MYPCCWVDCLLFVIQQHTLFHIIISRNRNWQLSNEFRRILMMMTMKVVYRLLEETKARNTMPGGFQPLGPPFQYSQSPKEPYTLPVSFGSFPWGVNLGVNLGMAYHTSTHIKHFHSHSIVFAKRNEEILNLGWFAESICNEIVKP